MTKPRILLVTNSPARRTSLCGSLQAANHVECFEKACVHSAVPPDLILLAAEESAAGMISQFRAQPAFAETPVFVWLQKPGDIARVLRLGADECVGPDTSFTEVQARIDAVLRRARHNGIAVFGDVRVDLRHSVATVGAGSVSLTPKEVHLLAYLVSHAGSVVARDELLREVWGYAFAVTRAVDIHMSALRKKLENDPRRPTRLVTVRGRGYQFVP